MSNLEQKWAAITEKIQKIQEKHLLMQQEISQLNSKVQKLESENAELIKQKESLHNQINVLKLAPKTGLTDKERVEVKKQLKQYINEIDDCLAKMNA